MPLPKSPLSVVNCNGKTELNCCSNNKIVTKILYWVKYSCIVLHSGCLKSVPRQWTDTGEITLGKSLSKCWETTIQSFSWVTPTEHFPFRFELHHYFIGLSSGELGGLRLGCVLRKKVYVSLSTRTLFIQLRFSPYKSGEEAQSHSERNSRQNSLHNLKFYLFSLYASWQSIHSWF